MSKRPILSAVLILLLVVRSSAQQLPAEAEKALAYEPYMAAASARYGVDPKLLWTIAYLETRFNPRLVSPKGARGLMQFVPSTGRKYGLVNPFDPELSIDAAARYLRDLSTTFNERVDLVLAGYNAGEQAVKDADYKVPAFRETRSYVARGISVFRRISQAGKFSSDSLAPSIPASGQQGGAGRSPSRQSIYAGATSSEETKTPPGASRSIYFGNP
jgi:hypothetical protein